MSVRITPNSRLQFAELVKVNGVEFWDLPVLPEVTPDRNDTLYQVSNTDGQVRIDGIARKYLDDPRDWWIIAHLNEMSLLPGDIRNGDVIRILSKKRFLEDVMEES